MKKIIKEILICAAALITLLAVAGCKTVKKVDTQVERVLVHDTVRVVDVQRDSVVRADSVIIEHWVNGDTVRETIERWRTEFRDRLKVDTCVIAQVRDSVVFVDRYETLDSKAKDIKGKIWNMAIILCASVAIVAAIKWKHE